MILLGSSDELHSRNAAYLQHLLVVSEDLEGRGLPVVTVAPGAQLSSKNRSSHSIEVKHRVDLPSAETVSYGWSHLCRTLRQRSLLAIQNRIGDLCVLERAVAVSMQACAFQQLER